VSYIAICTGYHWKVSIGILLYSGEIFSLTDGREDQYIHRYSRVGHVTPHCQSSHMTWQGEATSGGYSVSTIIYNNNRDHSIVLTWYMYLLYTGGTNQTIPPTDSHNNKLIDTHNLHPLKLEYYYLRYVGSWF